MENPAALHHLESKLAQAWPVMAWQEVTVLVAVSGGADSVALLRGLHRLHRLKTAGTGRLIAAHFNHGLRGDEAAADASFVVSLCTRLELACEVGSAPAGSLAANSQDGIEAAARSARYEFLEQAAARLGARYIATGHTADDQAETILHRILRGTGIAGLAGMPRTRHLSSGTTLIRPLLEFHRNELVDYLAELGQSFREDSTNASLQFTRNRIRRQLLPEMAADYNPNVADALVRLGRLAREAQGTVNFFVAELAAQSVSYPSSESSTVRAAPLAGKPSHAIRELLIHVWLKRGWPLQAMGLEQWELLERMLISSLEPLSLPRKMMFPGGVVAESVPGELRLERRDGAFESRV